MMIAQRHRPADIGVMVSRTVLSIVRILIASYFLATATGLIFEPASRTFLDAVLPAAQAQLVTTIYLFLTSFAIMVGIAVRPCALLLSVYIFWSGYMHYDFGDPVALAAFWREMALLGAVLMIAVTEQGGGAQVRVWRKSVTPRRVATGVRQASLRRATPRPASGKPDKAPLRGIAHASGEIDIYECDSAEDDGDGDEADRNIFAAAFDDEPDSRAAV